MILKGKREYFFSVPDDSSLINLIGEAKRRKVRDSELKKVVAYLSEQDKRDREDNLEVKALLMVGRLEEAFLKTKSSKAVGWSYGGVEGALFAGILTALTNPHIDEANSILCVLERYTNTSELYYNEEEKPEDDQKISHEILYGLQNIKLTEEERERYLVWVDKIGKRRIDHIVSNKYRKAYRRAAEVLGALAECYILLGEKKGATIVSKYRDEKFNRYHAFRREVDSVISASKILKRYYRTTKRNR